MSTVKEMSECRQFQCSGVSRFVSIGEITCRPTCTHSIEELEVLEGTMPSKQLKMLLGWAAFHQEELRENWELAREQQELFAIEPLK